MSDRTKQIVCVLFEIVLGCIVTTALLGVIIILFWLMVRQANIYMTGGCVTLMTFLLGALVRFGEMTRRTLRSLFLGTLGEQQEEKKEEERGGWKDIILSMWGYLLQFGWGNPIKEVEILDALVLTPHGIRISLTPSNAYIVENIYDPQVAGHGMTIIDAAKDCGRRLLDAAKDEAPRTTAALKPLYNRPGYFT